MQCHIKCDLKHTFQVSQTSTTSFLSLYACQENLPEIEISVWDRATLTKIEPNLIQALCEPIAFYCKWLNKAFILTCCSVSVIQYWQIQIHEIPRWNYYWSIGPNFGCFKQFFLSWQVVYELKYQSCPTKAESCVPEASEGCAQPAHASSKLDKTAVTLGMIMYGNDVTDRTLHAIS